MVPTPDRETAQERLLIVDDDEVIRELLKGYLEREGFEVRLAEDARAMDRIPSATASI